MTTTDYPSMTKQIGRSPPSSAVRGRLSRARSGRSPISLPGRAFGLRILLPLLLLAAWPAVLAAHTELRWSRPADGDTLSSAPAEIRLRFTSPVEAFYTGITLLRPDGTRVPLPELAAEDGQREFAVAWPEQLPGGSYTVQWRTVAADGHVIEGSFTFLLEDEAPDPTELAPAAPPSPVAAPPAPAAPPTVPGFAAAESPFAVAVRFLHFAALLGLIGAVVFRLGILGRLPANPHPIPGSEVAAARTLRVAGIAFGLLALVIVARLWLQSVALHGAANAWSSEHLARMLGATVWGRAWLLQASAALLVLLGLLIARRVDRQGWLLVLLGGLGLAAVPGLSGHAATVEGIAWVAVLNDALHVLGAGAWLGTLALLLLAGLPALLRAGQARAASIATLVNRFSPVALGAASLVVITGVVNALLHFNAPAELWTTDYGRVLLLKLAVLLPVLGLGVYNWRVVRPSLGSDAASGRLQRSASAEISIGVLVVLVTAVLVAMPRP